MSELLRNVPKTDTGIEFIGDQAYRFRAYLFDNEGNTMPLKKDAFARIEIEDHILKWYHYGYVDIKNPYDIIERASVGKDARDILQNINKFQMRNDGTLNLYISIEPQLTSLGGGNTVIDLNAINDDDLSMEFLFSVYRVEDPPVKSIETKIKRLYLKDYRQFYLETHQSYYSTGDTLKKQNKDIKRVSHISSDTSEIHTGDAIKDFLEVTLGRLTTPQFGGTFDKGSYTIDYTSPANYYGSDDLAYLLGCHLSTDASNNCSCLLKCNRFVNDNQFYLVPVLDLYKHIYDSSTNTAGGLLTERFVITNPNAKSDDDYTSTKLPNKSTMPLSLYTFPEYSVITNYTYHDIQPDLNRLHLCSTVGHTYNNKNKKFSILTTSGNINNVKEFVKEHIVHNHPVDHTTKGALAWNIDPRTEHNETIKHQYFSTSNHEKASDASRNTIIDRSLFQGRTLGFTCKGITSRQSMRFIGLDRDAASTPNHLDNKLLGVWLTTSVKHIIEPVNGYTNQILASKQYNYDNLI
jgi:hypothetical protein